MAGGLKIIFAIAVILIAGSIGFMVLRPRPLPQAVVPPVPRQVVKAEEKPVYKRDMLDDEADAVVQKEAPPVAGKINPETELQIDGLPGKMILTSPQIRMNDKVPLDFTCYQKNTSPPLQWSGVPKGTRSFVVLLDPAEQGTPPVWLWAVYNIPATVDSLPQGLPKTPNLEGGEGQMANESGNPGYWGPCKPKGEFHYNLEVFALDNEPGLKGGASRGDLIRAMNGHILDMGKLPFSHYYRL